MASIVLELVHILPLFFVLQTLQLPYSLLLELTKIRDPEIMWISDRHLQMEVLFHWSIDWAIISKLNSINEKSHFLKCSFTKLLNKLPRDLFKKLVRTSIQDWGRSFQIVHKKWLINFISQSKVMYLGTPRWIFFFHNLFYHEGRWYWCTRLVKMA